VVPQKKAGFMTGFFCVFQSGVMLSKDGFGTVKFEIHWITSNSLACGFGNPHGRKVLSFRKNQLLISP
jgi:hypothetical protein